MNGYEEISIEFLIKKKKTPFVQQNVISLST